MSQFFAIYLFILALLLALIEIEIEGKDGWAVKTATFRKDLKNVPIIGKVAWSREITGYHIFLNIFLFAVFHLPYFFGHELNLTNELVLISYFMLFGVTWDFLWFVMNPHYGIRNFKKHKIPWFSENKWIIGNRVSIPHVFHLAISMLLTVLASILVGKSDVWTTYMINVGVFGVLVFVTIILAPHYHKLYWRLRKDE